MTKYITLLRGINVGGNKKVSMEKLRICFEKLGYSDVATFISSGNVVFQTSVTDEIELATKIEKVLNKAFGFEIRVVVLNEKSFKKIVKAVPEAWNNDLEQRTDVIFLWADFDKKQTLKLIMTNPAVDNLIYCKGAIIWNIKRSDYKKSAMRKFIGTEIYKNMTARNINTARKLAEML